MKNITRRTAIQSGAATVSNESFAATTTAAHHGSTKENSLRRKERELTTEEAREVIQNTMWAVLSTADTDGNPYGVPISPLLIDNTIYFHGSGLPGGRKANNMLMNKNVSLCFVAKANVLPEWYSIDFASAVVTGKAYQIDDMDEEKRIMKLIVQRLAPDNSQERNNAQEKFRMPLVKCWKVDIEQITGKARGAKKWVEGESVHTVQNIEPSSWLSGVPK